MSSSHHPDRDSESLTSRRDKRLAQQIDDFCKYCYTSHEHPESCPKKQEAKQREAAEHNPQPLKIADRMESYEILVSEGSEYKSQKGKSTAKPEPKEPSKPDEPVLVKKGKKKAEEQIWFASSRGKKKGEGSGYPKKS